MIQSSRNYLKLKNKRREKQLDGSIMYWFCEPLDRNFLNIKWKKSRKCLAIQARTTEEQPEMCFNICYRQEKKRSIFILPGK